MNREAREAHIWTRQFSFAPRYSGSGCGCTEAAPCNRHDRIQPLDGWTTPALALVRHTQVLSL